MPPADQQRFHRCNRLDGRHPQLPSKCCGAGCSCLAQLHTSRLLKKAWQQIKNDIDESGIDRQELLSVVAQTLMAAAGQAMQHSSTRAPS